MGRERMILVEGLLFDLDGTIVDSSKGIFGGVLYAAEKMALLPPSQAELTSFIGPPLQRSFERVFHLTAEASQQAVDFYREYYRQQGVKEVAPYSGLQEALAALATDYSLYIATSKPEIFAKEIIQDIGFQAYFSGIYGANLSGSRVKKADVIAYGLADIQPRNKKAFVMIGDREHDILGGKEHQLTTIGVLYGFGSKNELISAGADWLIQQPSELTELDFSLF